MRRKHRNLTAYALDCMRRYRLRTIVVLVTFLVATTMISSVLFAKEGLQREAEFSVKSAPDLTVQYLKAGRVAMVPQEYLGLVAEVEGVEAVFPRIWGYAGIGTNTYTMIGLDSGALNRSGSVDGTLESGRFLTSGDAGSGNVVIGKLLAGILGVGVGDDIILLSESVEASRFHVIGVFSDAVSIYSADMIVMSIEDAREFFSITGGYATDLTVYVEEGVNPQEVASRMSSLPNARVLDRDILLRGYLAAYGARGGIYTTLWAIVLVAVALVAFNQAIVVGQESRFEVGLLKTFGFTTLDVIEVRLIESLVLGFFAASLGMIVGFVYTAYFNAPGLVDILLGWAFLPGEFRMPVYVSLESVFSIYAVTVIPLLITTVVPAWLNAITDPELSMRRAAA